MTEASDPMVCEETLFMLHCQRKKGYWPAVISSEDALESKLDPYHCIHQLGSVHMLCGTAISA